VEDADSDADANLILIKHDRVRHSHWRGFLMAMPFADYFSFKKRKEIKRE